jgi:hypothetical protein
MITKQWRVLRDPWNIKTMPWSGAIGIEEVPDRNSVPGIVCWFTRGWESELAAEQIVAAHNASVHPPE